MAFGAANKPGDPLTHKQEEIFEFMKRFHRDNGYPPTLRNICKQFGFGGPNAARCHINALVSKGRLKRIQCGGTSHYIPTVPDGCCLACGSPYVDPPSKALPSNGRRYE